MMYAISGPVRCQFTVVRRTPIRWHAANVSENSGRFEQINESESPCPIPRARNARARRLALALSSPKVRSPALEMMAGRSGCWRAHHASVMPVRAASIRSSRLLAFSSSAEGASEPASVSVSLMRWCGACPGAIPR